MAICRACQKRNHEGCKGATWCFCQHRIFPTSEHEVDGTGAVREMHRHGKPATAYITDKVEGTIEALESANVREKRQRNPSPGQ